MMKITKQYIEENLLTKTKTLNPQLNKKHNVELSSEELYLIYHDTVNKCLICSNKTKFVSFKVGFRRTCSKECGLKLRDVTPRKEATYKRDVLFDDFLDNYNDITPSKEVGFYVKKVKNRKSKPSIDMYDLREYSSEIKYIVEESNTKLVNGYKNNNFREILYRFENKIKENPLCECGSNLRFINGNKGYSNYCSNSCAIKFDKTKINNSKSKLEKIIEDSKFVLVELEDINDKPSTLKCKECNHVFTKWFRNGRMNSLLLCPKCDKTKSSPEIELAELMINPVMNSRQIIKPLELDLYSEECKFAIEYNGLMWHSFGKSEHSMFNNYAKEEEEKDKHLTKTELCEEKGVQLFHVFEDEYLDKTKKSIWISIINGKQGLSTKIETTESQIREVPDEEAKNFINENHLQGYAETPIKLGLYYSNVLYCVMMFRVHNESADYELVRFCVKKGYTVPCNILEYFEKLYKPKSLLHYANRRYSTGDFCIKNGFTFKGCTKPNYFYFHPNKIDKAVETNKHNEKNMYDRGYRKVYDSGNKVFIKEY